MSSESYGSIKALRKLLYSDANAAEILRISPKGYKTSSGIEYCYVGLRLKNGADYSINAFGKEAIELYKEAKKWLNTIVVDKEIS